MSIQQDTRKMLADIGMKHRDFAALVGVHPTALSKFLRSKGCSIAERLVPYVYGDKRPTAPTAPPAPARCEGDGDAGPCPTPPLSAQSNEGERGGGNV